MRDTLDLKQLEQQAESEQTHNDIKLLKPVRYLVYGIIVVVLLLGAASWLGNNPISSFLKSLPNDMSLIILLPVAGLITVLGGLNLLNKARPQPANQAAARMEKELQRMPPLDDLPSRSRMSNVLVVIIVVVGAAWFFAIEQFDLPYWSFIVLLVPFILVAIAAELLGKYWLTRGNYDAVIRLSQFMRRFLSADAPFYAGTLGMEGFALMLSGKTDECIPYFLEHLNLTRRTRDPYQISGSLNNLGYALVMAERYDEALPLLESSLSIKPDLSNAYDSLACLYLEQGVHPERALEIAQAALEYTPKTKSTARGVQLATGARAYALTKNANYTKVLVGEALAMAGSGHLDAEIYRQVGHAAQAMGNIAAARKYFQQAIKLDPQGLYGQKARRALLATKTLA